VPAGTNLLFFCRSERACSSSSIGMGLAVEPHAVANHRQQLGFIEKVGGRSRQRCRRHASRAAELGSRVERHGQSTPASCLMRATGWAHPSATTGCTVLPDR